MIIWIPDKSGRFRQRPYFLEDYMNRRCERIVDRYNLKLYGQPYPGLRTAALTKLLEKYADLYLYEDLSDEGEGIEAVTYFRIGKKPIVRISRELTFDPSRNHHTRFVIAHEYGHVRLHAVGWRRRWIKQEDVLRCSAKNVLTLDNGYDWLEWQASFLGASSLIPESRVLPVVEAYFCREGFSRVPRDSRQARDITQRVSELFEVSDQVANIRLSDLGYLIK